MAKLLVVEDDSLLNNTLTYNLQADGYETGQAFNLASARALLAEDTFDLFILDVNLPDGTGFDFCREVKAKTDALVIFLTANDMESDMLKGYELGAEDYVTKPFPMSVFLKKISVLLRRTAVKANNDIFDDGHLFIDFSAFSARLDGDPLILTPLEYRTLKILISNPKIVQTRQLLLEKLWDADGNFVDENTLTSAISRIRSKIEQGSHSYIKTVYGMGYTWTGDANHGN